MSVFNRAYRNDKQLKADAKLKKKQRKARAKADEYRLSTRVFDSIVSLREDGGDHFTKEDMMELAVGRRVRPAEKDSVMMNTSFTCGLNRARAYFWTDDDDSTEVIKINYIRPERTYWFIELLDKYRNNKSYDDYDRKMRGIQEEMGERIKKGYEQTLISSPAERKKYLKDEELKRFGIGEKGDSK